MDLYNNHIGDGSKPHALPIIQGRHADLKCINATTLVKLIDNCFCDTIDSFTIVDCRYPYEYEGGHILGSINIYTKDGITREFIDPSSSTTNTNAASLFAPSTPKKRTTNRENSFSDYQSLLFPTGSPQQMTPNKTSSPSNNNHHSNHPYNNHHHHHHNDYNDHQNHNNHQHHPSRASKRTSISSNSNNRENHPISSQVLFPSSSPVSNDSTLFDSHLSMSQPSTTSIILNSSLANTNGNNKRHVLIFHCEFSSERAPKLLRHLRNKDRDINRNHYPRLMHPELYLLEGGYKAFYAQYKQYCEPQSYRPMGCKEHTEDLRVYKSMNRSRKRLKKC